MVTSEGIHKPISQLPPVATTYPNYNPHVRHPALTDPNYVPANRGPALVVAIIVFAVILTTFIAVRLYVRKIYVGRWYAEDWLALVALIVVLPLSGMHAYAAAKFGLGMHVWDLTTDQIEKSYKTQYAYTILYTTSTFLVKLVVVASIYRLETSSLRKKFCLAFAFITVCLNITLICYFTFRCAPVKSAWDIHAKAKSGCVKKHYLVNIELWIVSYVFTDVVCLLLPVPLVWRLRLPLRRKLEVAAMFGLGTFAAVVAMVRIKYLRRLLKSFDMSWDGFPVFLCDTVELNIGLIVTCIPVVRLLFQKKFPSFYGRSKKTRPTSVRILTHLKHSDNSGSIEMSRSKPPSSRKEEHMEIVPVQDVEKGGECMELDILERPTTDEIGDDVRRKRLELRYQMADVDLDESLTDGERTKKLNRMSEGLEEGVA